MKEILPPRKSLRLQNISAETGRKLREKEPSKYFTYDPTEVENSRLPLRDLELTEFISEKDKSAKPEDVSSYLTRVNDSLNMKYELTGQGAEDVPKRLKQMKITVSSYFFFLHII